MTNEENKVEEVATETAKEETAKAEQFFTFKQCFYKKITPRKE